MNNKRGEKLKNKYLIITKKLESETIKKEIEKKYYKHAYKLYKLFKVEIICEIII